MLPSYTRETRIITDAYWAEPYMEHIIKGVNMSEYPEKNMGRRSRRSKKGASAHRHHMFSEEDTHEATKAKGLFENRANGDYSEGGIGMVPISILT